MRPIMAQLIFIMMISIALVVQSQMVNTILGTSVQLFRVLAARTGSFNVLVQAPLEIVPYSRTAVLRFGLTNCQQTFWLSITTLQCKSPVQHFDSISNTTISYVSFLE
jgi:hypothetical protein